MTNHIDRLPEIAKAETVIGTYPDLSSSDGRGVVMIKEPPSFYFLAIGLFGWNEQKKHPQEIVVTHGTSEQIMFDLRDAGLVIAVNITDMIARLRAKGLAAGIDLSQPFFFPPDHERYFQIISEFEAERGARLARLRRDKKKWRNHNAFVCRNDVKLATRLRDQPAQPLSRLE